MRAGPIYAGHVQKTSELWVGSVQAKPTDFAHFGVMQLLTHVSIGSARADMGKSGPLLSSPWSCSDHFQTADDLVARPCRFKFIRGQNAVRARLQPSSVHPIDKFASRSGVYPTKTA